MTSWERAGERLATAARRDGDPTRWFEELYASAARGDVDMPWNRSASSPVLDAWFSARDPDPTSRTLVVGCGLGADAEDAAARGFPTIAFDVSPTAIDTARARYPDTSVDYRVADLFALPLGWQGAFDLVVENITVQALPREHRARALAALPGLVAPGGRLVVVENVSRTGEDAGPPWPFTREDMESCARGGLETVSIDEHPGPPVRWCAEFRRTG